MTNDETTPLSTSELHPFQPSVVSPKAARMQDGAPVTSAQRVPSRKSVAGRTVGSVLGALWRRGKPARAVPAQTLGPRATQGMEAIALPVPSRVAHVRAPKQEPRYLLPEPTLALPRAPSRMLATHSSRNFAKMPRHVWLVQDVFHGGEVIILWGESQAGKTVLLLNLVAAIARGSSWAGHPVFQTNVLYVALEAQIGVRSRAQALEHDLGTGPLDGIHYVFEPCNLAIEEDVNALAQAALQHGAKFIVIDTLSASIAGALEENSNSAMARVIANLQRLSQMTGAAVLIVHHTGNDPSRGARGAYALHANPDVSIEVGRSQKEHYWRLIKSRDGKQDVGGKFKIEAVTFQLEQEDEPQESIVVRHLEAVGVSPALPFSPRVTKAQERADGALAAIRECLLADIVGGGQPASTGMSCDEARLVVTAAFQDYGQKHRAQYVRESLEVLVTSGRLVQEGDTLRLPA